MGKNGGSKVVHFIVKSEIRDQILIIPENKDQSKNQDIKQNQESSSQNQNGSTQNQNRSSRYNSGQNREDNNSRGNFWDLFQNGRGGSFGRSPYNPLISMMRQLRWLDRFWKKLQIALKLRDYLNKIC